MAMMNVLDLQIVRQLISTKNRDLSLRRLELRAQQAETRNLQVQPHPSDSFLRLPVSLQRTLAQGSGTGRQALYCTRLAYFRDLPLWLLKALKEFGFLNTLEGANYSKDIFINVAPSVEKLNLGYEREEVLAWLFVLIYQQQLKSMVIKINANLAFQPLAICLSRKRGHRFFGPKLRSMSLGDVYLWSEPEKEAIGELFSLHRNQLTSLQLDAFWLLPGLDPLPMTRLKHLDICFRYNSCFGMFMMHLVMCIELEQLESLSIRLVLQPGLPTAIQFLNLVTKMTNLKKFSLQLSYASHAYQQNGNQQPILYDQPSNQSEMKGTLENLSKAFKYGKFKNIQVMRLGAQVPNVYVRKRLPFGQSMAGLEFIVELLMPKLCHTIRKLIIQVPNMFADEQSKFIRLVNMPQLRVLVLNYSKFHNTDQYFASITKLVSDDFNFLNVRTLTITDLPVINESICMNILKVFPNLYELNIGALRGRFYSLEFSGETFASIITKLKHLRILRFTDDYPKLDKLAQTIKVLKIRAESVRPVKPFVLRVPIDRKLLELIREFPQNSQNIPDSKWLRIY